MSRILILEDEMEYVENIIDSIEDIVDEIDYVHNGKDGLLKIDESKYDLILSDINMPIMNGIKFYQELQNRNIEIPIIFLSAHCSRRFLKDKFDLEVLDSLDVMAKPYDEDALRLKIQEILK